MAWARYFEERFDLINSFGNCGSQGLDYFSRHSRIDVKS